MRFGRPVGQAAFGSLIKQTEMMSAQFSTSHAVVQEIDAWIASITAFTGRTSPPAEPPWGPMLAKQGIISRDDAAKSLTV